MSHFDNDGLLLAKLARDQPIRCVVERVRERASTTPNNKQTNHDDDDVDKSN